MRDRWRWWRMLRGKSRLRPARGSRATAARGATAARRTATRRATGRLLDRIIRGLPVLVMLGGLYLTLLGVASSVGQFGAGASRLVDMAGFEGLAISSAQFIQDRVAALLGYTPPVMAQDSATPEPGQGFIPYQVAAGEREQAPALAADATGSPAAAKVPPAAAIPLTGAGDSPQVAPGSITPDFPPAAPDRIRIPAIKLDAPVVLAPRLSVMVNGQAFLQWDAPGYFAAGWQEGSAPPGQPGNTVINGHHNIDGQVFGHLRDLKPGDRIDLSAGTQVFHYEVVQAMKLPERGMPLTKRMENARWIMPSSDERLTLVTCWPPDNNTDRLIVVAAPLRP